MPFWEMKIFKQKHTCDKIAYAWKNIKIENISLVWIQHNTQAIMFDFIHSTYWTVRFQFDGVHVVSGSLDTSIRVWDVESGQLKHTLTGHQSLTSGMELHSNILVSGNADSTVKVWDITTGHCLHTLAGKLIWNFNCLL